MLTSLKADIVNVRSSECTHYCGRPEWYKNNGKDYSILGNPFSATEYGRDKACDMYDEYFHMMLKDEDFKSALDEIAKSAQLEDVRLGCWCAPKRCHTETIRRWLIDEWTK